MKILRKSKEMTLYFWASASLPWEAFPGFPSPCSLDSKVIVTPPYMCLFNFYNPLIGLPWWLRQQNVCLQCKRPGFDPWVGKIPWRMKWQPTPVLLLGKSHGQRSLIGYSSWGLKESDMTEWLHFHFHFQSTEDCKPLQRGLSKSYSSLYL